MNDCIFCKIVSHTVPARIIAEDEWCLAIVPLDIEVDDHLVVLPKSHYLGMLDIPKEDSASNTRIYAKGLFGIKRTSWLYRLQYIACNRRGCATIYAPFPCTYPAQT